MYFIMHGLYPFLMPSHAFIFACSAIVLFVLRNDKNALNRIPIIVVLFIGYSYLSYLIWFGRYQTLRYSGSLIDDLFAFLLFVPIAIIILSVLMYFVLVQFVFVNVEKGSYLIKYVLPIGFTFVMVLSNMNHISWMNSINLQIALETIEMAINKKSIDACSRINDVYYIGADKVQQNSETIINQLDFRGTSLKLCKKTANAVIQHKFSYCDSDDKEKRIRLKYINSKDGQYASPDYNYQAIACLGLYLQYYPDEEEDINDYFGGEYKDNDHFTIQSLYRLKSNNK